MLLRFPSLVVRAPEPQFDLKSNDVLAVMLKILSPGIEYSRFLNSVLNAPATNVLKAKKYIPKTCQLLLSSLGRFRGLGRIP